MRLQCGTPDLCDMLGSIQHDIATQKNLSEPEVHPGSDSVDEWAWVPEMVHATCPTGNPACLRRAGTLCSPSLLSPRPLVPSESPCVSERILTAICTRCSHAGPISRTSTSLLDCAWFRILHKYEVGSVIIINSLLS